MLRRRRRTHVAITGLLTALLWVCSMLQAPTSNESAQRQLERAFAGAAPVVATNAPTLRLEHGVAPRHGATHSSDPADALSRALDPSIASRIASPRASESLVTPARYRIAPHDATAPPLGGRSA